ncbi:MAG: hypothetical protein ACXWXY_01390 [Aeromicrobium sp.]
MRLVTTVASVALVAACGGDGDSDGKAAADSDQLPQGNEVVILDPADFTTRIDNPYWPMVPGTQRTFREVDSDGSIVTVVVTVTSETKRIANGITARVVRDTVRRDGDIIEDTFDWYAQDAQGSVWYLGEDTAEYENGKEVSTAGSFEAGVDGAQPGIAMPAKPTQGLAYRQEYYKGEAEDNGEVLSTSEMVDVKYGHFGPVLLTKDTITNDPEVLEYKFYAPGVGPVLTLDISGGVGREELVSVKKVPDGTATSPLGQPD